MAPGTNPEQLFALGYGACWQNAMIGIARRKGLDVLDSVVTAKVGIGPIGAGRLGLTVELIITLPSITDRDEAQALVDEAEQRCPYSNAVRGNVEVTLTLSDPHNRRVTLPSHPACIAAGADSVGAWVRKPGRLASSWRSRLPFCSRTC